MPLRKLLILSFRDNDSPTIVGEFSLSVPDIVQDTSAWSQANNKAFYAQWFAAQVQKYELHTNGWIFWTWKSQLTDYRWDYQYAVNQQIIPANLANLNQNHL
jgi:hypothetical protein